MIQTPPAQPSIETSSPKINFKKYWWVGLIIVLVVLIVVVVILVLGKTKTEELQPNNDNNISNNGNDNNKDTGNSQPDKKNQLTTTQERYLQLNMPDCPADLSGLLTASYVDPQKIASLIPLGNAAPPGHTFPVDHVYFTSFQEKGQIPKTALYSPGSGIITDFDVVTNYGANHTVLGQSFGFTLALCKGVVVKVGGGTELTPEFKTQLDQLQGDCQNGPAKHEGETSITQCYYTTNITATAGQQIGYTGGEDYPEVWAYNYNTAPDPTIDWSRYGYADYGYAFCLFDMYQGDLKTTLYSKFGEYTTAGGKNPVAKFVPRTVQPICGQAHQNVQDTIQGDWFGTTGKDTSNMGVEFGGTALALIHSNFDPMLGRIVVAGTISNAGFVEFTPTHTGNVNREFSEVTADGNIYCYPITTPNQFSINGKFLFQLVDVHHLKAENQTGTCQASESFKSPVNYDR